MKEISYLRFLSYENIFRGILENIKNKFGDTLSLKTYSVSNNTLSELWKDGDEDFYSEANEDAGCLVFKGVLMTGDGTYFYISIDSMGHAKLDYDISNDVDSDFLYTQDCYKSFRSYLSPALLELKEIREFNFLEIVVENILNLLLFGEKNLDQRQSALTILLEMKEKIFPI